MELTVEDFYLQSIDTTSSASYEAGEDFVDFLYEDIENRMGKWKHGLIHSHHNDDVYFSGTDEDELKQSAPDHNMYLSVIVNNDGDIEARIAFHVKNSMKLRDVDGTWIEKEHEYIGYWEVDIVIVYDTEDYIKERIEDRIKERKSRFKGRFDRSTSDSVYEFSEYDWGVSWKHQQDSGEKKPSKEGHYYDIENPNKHDVKVISEWYKELVFGTYRDYNLEIFPTGDEEFDMELSKEILEDCFQEEFVVWEDPSQVVYNPVEYIEYLIEVVKNSAFLNEQIVRLMEKTLKSYLKEEKDETDDTKI